MNNRLFVRILSIYIVGNSINLQAMERSESARITHMQSQINQNQRIGKIGTLVLKDAIDNTTFKTLYQQIKNHSFIKTKEKITYKSCSLAYKYAPFILKAIISKNDNVNLSNAIVHVLHMEFNPESQRNDLNDSYFNENDAKEGFFQVDYCVSAKYTDETKMYIAYLVRFFNKDALSHALDQLNPELLALQEQTDSLNISSAQITQGNT